MSRESELRAAERMAAEKGMDVGEAQAVLAGRKDELARLVALLSYVEWAQVEGVLDPEPLPAELEKRVSEAVGFGRPPFENLRAGSWYALADGELFGAFAAAEGLRDGVGIRDLILLPDDAWEDMENHRGATEEDAK